MRIRRTVMVAIVIALGSSPPLSAAEYRSREVTREFQREHPCPSTGKTSGAWLPEGSRCPARLRRTRRGFEHAMADDPRCEDKGQVGTKGLRSLTVRVPGFRTGDHHVNLAAAAFGADEPLAPIR
jgi:hypothetical protein